MPRFSVTPSRTLNPNSFLLSLFLSPTLLPFVSLTFFPYFYNILSCVTERLSQLPCHRGRLVQPSASLSYSPLFAPALLSGRRRGETKLAIAITAVPSSSPLSRTRPVAPDRRLSVSCSRVAVNCTPHLYHAYAYLPHCRRRSPRPGTRRSRWVRLGLIAESSRSQRTTWGTWQKTSGSAHGVATAQMGLCGNGRVSCSSVPVLSAPSTVLTFYDTAERLFTVHLLFCLFLSHTHTHFLFPPPLPASSSASSLRTFLPLLPPLVV